MQRWSNFFETYEKLSPFQQGFFFHRVVCGGDGGKYVINKLSHLTLCFV